MTFAFNFDIAKHPTFKLYDYFRIKFEVLE